MSKFTANKRISALKRLGTTTNTNNSRASSTAETAIRDARQILTKKKSSSFDARQLLNRQGLVKSTNDVAVRNRILPNKTVLTNTVEKSDKMIVVTGLKDMKIQGGRLVSNAGATTAVEQKQKKIFAVGSSTFVTIRNPAEQKTESASKISLTKTIKNPNVSPEPTLKNPFATNEKCVISFVNDAYQKNTASVMKNRSPTPEVATSNKNLHDASIQTVRAATSVAGRAPIRTNSQQRHIATNTTQTKKRALSDDEENDNEHLDISQDEFYEPPLKRASVALRKTSKDDEEQMASNSAKRVSTTSSASSRITSTKTKPVFSNTGTILVTNLQPSVTEEDVIELFEQCGQIVEITTLSRGCVQIIYARREFAEQAVADYHNRLLDGQLMYVSLQQATTSNTKKILNSDVKTTSNNVTQLSKDSGTSNQQPSKQNPTTTTTTPSTTNTSGTTNSNKIVIDPTFIRQALFHPTNNTTNPVQFQVKL